MKPFIKIKIASLQAIGVAALVLIAGAGCDDGVAQRPAATTKPAVVENQTSAGEFNGLAVAFPARPPAIFSIDGRDVAFPAARLAVISHRGGLTLRLFSDDPPAAIDPGYVGNSFSFDMRLGIDRVEDIPASTWDHRPADADDDASGIFVHGNHDGYRLDDVHITFQKTDGQTLAYVDGTFLHNDSENPAAPPERVHASGCLHISNVE